MRATVVGGGIGGLTLALALAARGVRPRILERAGALVEAGAGVQLGPNAVRILDGLGLGDRLRAKAFAPLAAEVWGAASGRLRLSVPLGAAAEARWGAPYLQIHRGDLQAILLDAVSARGAADLRLGAEVTAADADGSVRLADGDVIAADVVVGCDGARSGVRAAVAFPGPPRFLGQVAWRAMIPANLLEAGLVPPTAAVWAGRGAHVVHYFVRGGAAVNLVAVIEERRWRVESWSEPGDPAELARAFTDWPEPVRTLTALAGAGGEGVFRWALFDRPPLKAWSRGRAVLLGDAAHPLPPFLAQGAAMAIEDAAVLARELTSGAEAEAGLAAFAAARAPRLAKVHAWSRRNARLFHLPGLLGDAAFAAARVLDARDPTGGMARFDWLYGFKA